MFVCVLASTTLAFVSHPRPGLFPCRPPHLVFMDAEPVDAEEPGPLQLSRASVLKFGLYTAWAFGAGTSIGRLLDFPPASFRDLARSIYLEAQAGVLPATTNRRLRVLEIGCGTGLESAFGDRFVANSEVLAVDVDAPNAKTLEAAQSRAATAGSELRFRRGDATDLSFMEESSVDVVVCSLTLCSVQSAEAAVRAVRRVLRPGGRFGFVEHVVVRAEDERPLLAASQSLLDPLQQVLAHGCHLTRDSPALIVDAFEREGGGKVLRMERRVEDAMWPVSQIAAGVVQK